MVHASSTIFNDQTASNQVLGEMSGGTQKQQPPMALHGPPWPSMSLSLSCDAALEFFLGLECTGSPAKTLLPHCLFFLHREAHRYVRLKITRPSSTLQELIRVSHVVTRRVLPNMAKKEMQEKEFHKKKEKEKKPARTACLRPTALEPALSATALVKKSTSMSTGIPSPRLITHRWAKRKEGGGGGDAETGR